MGNLETPYGEKVLNVSCLELGEVDVVVSDNNGELSVGLQAREVPEPIEDILVETCPARRLATGSGDVTLRDFEVCLENCDMAEIATVTPIDVKQAS